MNNTSAKNAQIKYAAFLRGINVGGNSVIRMDDLQKAFEALGFRNVKTVLASGNVLFEAPPEDIATLSGHITKGLRTVFGRDILAIVRPIADLREIQAMQPFKSAIVIPGTRLFVTFLSENKGPGDIIAASGHDGFRILSSSDGVICSVLYEQHKAVNLMSAIEKEFGQRVTTRTWNTIAKILKLSNKG